MIKKQTKINKKTNNFLLKYIKLKKQIKILKKQSVRTKNKTIYFFYNIICCFKINIKKEKNSKKE